MSEPDPRLAIRLRTCTLLIWIILISRQSPDLLPAFRPDPGDGFGLVGILASHTLAADIVYRPGFVAAIRAVSIAFCLLALLRPSSSTILRLTATLVVTWDSLNKSVGGYANHAQFLPLALLVIFAIHPVGPNRWFLQRASEVDGRYGNNMSGSAPLVTALWQASLCVVLPYTYVGLNRLLDGGIGILRPDAIATHMRLACMGMPSDTCVWLNRLPADPYRSLFAAGFVMVTLMEVLSGLALASRNFRTGWLCFMLGFQLVAAAGMNILFWENMVLLSIMLHSTLFHVPGRRRTILVPSGTTSVADVNRSH